MTVDLDSRSDAPARSGVLASDEAASPGTAFRRAREALERPVLGAIGRYAVLGQIAGGGMGSVFLAHMRGPAGFSRPVAIKCLHTRWLDDPKFVARFTAEVKLCTLIRHPNVVQALDVVEDAGELFLVLEYVDGVTLAALLADLRRCERPLPVDLALGIVAAALRGLHAAHEATDETGVPCRIVHRDVSPQNIMVSRTGHVSILDFGAAKSREHSQQTAAGVLVGKLAYTAPEQVQGERSSPRSDVFSAGVVLWEALVGKRLFHDPARSRAELLHDLVLEPVAWPSQYRADVPRAVDDVVRKALERDPERRFQTAAQFADALEAAGVSRTGPALGELVGAVCAGRLSEKEGLWRRGVRAALDTSPVESASTPRSSALAVPASRSVQGLVSGAWPRAPRGSPTLWLGAVALVGVVAGWCVDALWHRGDEPAARPLEQTALSLQPTSSAAAREHLTASRPPSSSAPSPSIPSQTGRVPVVIERPSPPRERARSARSERGQAPRAVSSHVRRAASERPRETGAMGACDPPTYMDAAGIRHFKKDCL
jgi:tRNA A-37 threonylcarbamoyl transferase component Bud32